MKVAMLSPVAWRTPPKHYGPWEQVASNITEGLLQKGIEVTLFATGDSETKGKLASIIPQGYEEDKTLDAKVAECMHISYLMEQADEFDLIHNNFDFLPLTYSRLVKTPVITTIHGFSSQKIIPVYKKYNPYNYYISISNADRNKDLHYYATIYHGLKKEDFSFIENAGEYLLFFGRIHPDKGTYDAIEIAKRSKRKLIIAGIIQDEHYFKEKVEPYIDHDTIEFVGHADAQKRKILLGNAYALLHPIYFNEPFGLSVVESMFCGTPVIAYTRGSMPEIVENNISGFLVQNCNEAVERLLEIKNIDRTACYTYATEKFNYENMIDQYLQAYEYVCAHPLK